MTFPPVDCRGLDIQCGDFVQFVVGTKVVTIQAIAVFIRDGKWVIGGLTPAGEDATIEGMEGENALQCKVVLMPPGVQFQEGLSLVDDLE